jgi:hypothetical protein
MRTNVLACLPLSALCALLPAADAFAAVPVEAKLEAYLPTDVTYDPAIPKPAETLGWDVGTWHVRHDQLARYLELLDQTSQRITFETIGHTHEQRPLINLVISSPANLERLSAIRDEHAKLSDGRGHELDLAKMPAVVYLGHSIHGNESSGANAAMLTAYYLAAAQGPKIEAMLANTVILLDPALNPDGLARFAQWANQHRGRVPNADPMHREHVEPWPNGRTNHYFFDLNRDWLPAVHPESQARLRQFHTWRPNVLTDFHEMGSDGTYFFQPGIPSRQNPLTPAKNLELTRLIAKFHAQALDRIGSLYYTEESFDDFYYGKGSTYPDIQGAVGILFEQASSRGHVQETAGGLLSFPFTIRNQFTTALSTLEAVAALRTSLLDEQRNFYRDALAEAGRDPMQALVFGDAGDPTRAFLLAQLLRRHRIEVRPLQEAVEVDGVSYKPGAAYVVPYRQAQYRLIRAIFEQRTQFADEAFYDVSAWSLHLAYGVQKGELGVKAWRPSLAGEPLGNADRLTVPGGRFEADPQAIAYAFGWERYFAPRAVQRLQRRGVVLRAGKQSFGTTVEPARAMGRGTILVPMAGQSLSRADLEALLADIAKTEGLVIEPVATGLTAAGIDLGSPEMRPLRAPRAALLVGAPFDPYQAGEVWHLLDHRFGMDLSLLQKYDVSRGAADLGRYTHLIVVSGSGELMNKAESELVARWVRAGGVLLTVGSSASWADRSILRPPAEPAAGAPARTEAKDEKAEEPPRRQPYGDYEQEHARTLIAGAIFETDLDLTHPLAFGYTRPKLAVFRDNETFLKAPPEAFATVAAYEAKPLMAGYIAEKNLDKLAGTPAVVAERLGRGAVLRYVDNPNFRGFWNGGTKLFLNGLYFGGLIDPTRLREEAQDAHEAEH